MLRVPQFVVSVGLAVEGRPAVGVLINPASGEVFTGIVGGEATYDGAPCRVTTRDGFEGARLLVSATEHKKGWFAHLEGTCALEPMGSVAYKFGLVAAGLADATFTPQPRNEWDLIGGVACVAGGLFFAWRIPYLRTLVRPIYSRMGIIPEVAAGVQSATDLPSAQ